MSSGTPFGYRRVKVLDGGKERVKLEPDSNTSWVVQRIFELAISGVGVKEIVKWLNTEGIPSPAGKRWGKSMVHRVLVNPVYTGTLVWGSNGRYHHEAKLDPVEVSRAFPAIVEQGTFDRVRAVLKSRAPATISPRRRRSCWTTRGSAISYESPRRAVYYVFGWPPNGR